jgi:hypothetical protein
LITTLETKLSIAEVATTDQESATLEKARIKDQKEIEWLKVDLEQTQLKVQMSQTQISQQGELIDQLRAKLEFVESQVIDIGIFQSQVIEIRKRLSSAQQGVLEKVETIQSSFQLIDQVLENLSLKERDVGAARVAF